MFHGSIPAKMRSFVAETADVWGIKELWVGCSGNFTIERTLPTIAHHANDVTLYTAALGWWAAGEPSPITIKEEFSNELDWMQEGMETPIGIASTVMLGTRFFQSVGKSNRYHLRNYAAYKDQWPVLLEKTIARLEASGLNLASYYNGDVIEWLDNTVPEDAAIACFPPFFKGDYESQDKILTRVLDWPAPVYPLLDEEGKREMMEKIISRPNWIIGLQEQHEDLHEHLRGVMQTSNRGITINLYTSHSPVRVVTPSQKFEPVTAPRLDSSVTLDGTERVWLSKLTHGQFTALRSRYMNHHIKPGECDLVVAVMVGEYLTGVVAFNSPNPVMDQFCVYLLSDFPVSESKYLRLASLMGMVAQTTEVQLLLSRSMGRWFQAVGTTAFSANPVSMKYRSAGLKCLKRTETNGEDFNKWELQYEAPLGRWTLQEAYEYWFKKFGNKVKETETS